MTASTQAANCKNKKEKYINEKNYLYEYNEQRKKKSLNNEFLFQGIQGPPSIFTKEALDFV